MPSATRHLEGPTTDNQSGSESFSALNLGSPHSGLPPMPRYVGMPDFRNKCDSLEYIDEATGSYCDSPEPAPSPASVKMPRDLHLLRTSHRSSGFEDLGRGSDEVQMKALTFGEPKLGPAKPNNSKLGRLGLVTLFPSLEPTVLIAVVGVEFRLKNLEPLKIYLFILLIDTPINRGIHGRIS